MKTVVSTKGQIVLPSPIRHRLGIQTGDELDAKVEGKHVVLIPARMRKRHGKTMRDSVTGMPVLTFGADTPLLTSRQVEKMLEDFP